MPPMNEMTHEEVNVKLCLIANSKAGKTHYAAQAAADGFNVLYCDGDVSRPTLSQFSKEAKERIFYLPFNDAVSESGQYIPRFYLLLKEFLKSGEFAWNDTKSRMLQMDKDEGDSIYSFNASRLDSNWVLVIDSWTSVAYSIMSLVALNAGVDLGDMDKAGQTIYGNANNAATDLLTRIRNLKCHVILIAHPDEYVKYKNKRGRVQEMNRTENREIEWTRLIPKSISRPHGLTIASYFTDVAWVELTPMGERRINFESSPDKEGGGRFEGKLPINEGAFARLVERAGGQVPKDAHIAGNSAMVHTPSFEPPEGFQQKPTVMNPSTSAAPGKVNMGVGPTGIKKPGLSLKLK